MNKKTTLPEYSLKPWTSTASVALLMVIFVSITLNVIGLSWGSTGHIPWHSDSIAGATTMREMPRLFGQWTYKYPRAQFLINAAFYKPMLAMWEKNLIWTIDKSGNRVPQMFTEERVNELILISNTISALMGAATVAAVFLTARILFDDLLAGFLSALSLAVCQLFVFYSHLGNVDVPSIFWFSWGMFFAVKVAYIGKFQHFVLAGLFFALSACTKDPMIIFIAGLAIAIYLIMVKNALDQGRSFKQASISMMNTKLIVAIIVFLFIYALLNDLITSPDAFAKRIGNSWLGKSALTRWDTGFTGQLPLLYKACTSFYGSFGWPLTAVILLSIIYCSVKYPRQCLIGIVPPVLFYVVVIVKIHMFVPRFLMPAYPGLVILAGKGCADFMRYKKLPKLLRLIPVLVVYILSALYCIGLDLEMKNDSRYDAENWIVRNVSPKTHVGILSNMRFAPRLHMLEQNCSFRIPPGGKNLGEEILRQKPSYPKYIIFHEGMLGKFKPDFLNSILNGTLGYQEVARFENKYLYPKKTIFGIAGWPKVSRSSPTITIYEKNSR